MGEPQLTSTWLSAEMANVFAAMFELDKLAILEAANELTKHTAPARVISDLLQQDANLASARGVVEALGALRDLSA